MDRRDDFKYVWHRVTSALAPDAPDDILQALTDTGVSYEVKATDLILSIPAVLKDYMEEHMSRVKPTLWPFIQRNGCNRMIYKLY